MADKIYIYSLEIIKYNIIYKKHNFVSAYCPQVGGMHFIGASIFILHWATNTIKLGQFFRHWLEIFHVVAFQSNLPIDLKILLWFQDFMK